MTKISCFKLTRALLARLLFAFHGLLAIWRVAFTYKDPIFWLFALLIIAIFVEGGVNILQREGNETRWFCPSIFLYLGSTVPPLWFLELHLSHTQQLQLINGTIMEEVPSQYSGTILAISSEVQVEIPIPILSTYMWAQILEQTLLVILIMGRWILPRGDISREQLSQLLLVYLATAADIAELFEVFKESDVRSSRRLTVVILILWSTALMQYPLVLTSVKAARKPRMGCMVEVPTNQSLATSNSDTNLPLPASTSQHRLSSVRAARLHQLKRMRNPFWRVCVTDINMWGIIICVILQDGPFLLLRLYLMGEHNIVSYSMIFFTCKNVLLCMLQGYRLSALCYELKKAREEYWKEVHHEQEEAEAMRREMRKSQSTLGNSSASVSVADLNQEEQGEDEAASKNSEETKKLLTNNNNTYPPADNQSKASFVYQYGAGRAKNQQHNGSLNSTVPSYHISNELCDDIEDIDANSSLNGEPMEAKPKLVDIDLIAPCDSEESLRQE